MGKKLSISDLTDPKVQDCFTDDAIVKRVVEIQAEVPLLARVTNLDERVRRQLAVIER